VHDVENLFYINKKYIESHREKKSRREEKTKFISKKYFFPFKFILFIILQKIKINIQIAIILITNVLTSVFFFVINILYIINNLKFIANIIKIMQLKLK